MRKPRTNTSHGKRVAYLCLDSGVPALGHKGASVHLRSICTALGRAGCDVVLHCNRIGGDLQQTKAFSRQCIEHRIPDGLKRLQRDLRGFYGAELRIPAETRQAMINKSVLPELVKAWELERPDFVLERLSLMGVAGLRACQSLAICHALEVNALMSDEARAFRSLNDYEAARRAEDEVIRSTDYIFCVSAELKRIIIERGAEANRVQILPNGYDQALFRPRSAVALRRKLKIADHFTIGMVGSLKSWHGVALMLESMLSWPPCKKMALLIVGQGPESARIAAFRDKHPELLLVQVGAVPHTEIPKYIAACDVCAAPYESDDSFYFSPLKVYEYLAMGKPVIASDQGQIRDIIQHEQTGLLYKAGSISEFTAAVERLRRSPKLRQRLELNAKHSVKNNTWEKNARRICAAVEEACS